MVKKPDYEPDEDIDNFKVEIHNRAVKKVKAELNKNEQERQIGGGNLIKNKRIRI